MPSCRLLIDDFVAVLFLANALAIQARIRAHRRREPIRNSDDCDRRCRKDDQ